MSCACRVAEVDECPELCRREADQVELEVHALDVEQLVAQEQLIPSRV
jgi:hypothetical protein